MRRFIKNVPKSDRVIMGLLFSYNERGGLFMRGWVRPIFTAFVCGSDSGSGAGADMPEIHASRIFGTYFSESVCKSEN